MVIGNIYLIIKEHEFEKYFFCDTLENFINFAADDFLFAKMSHKINFSYPTICTDLYRVIHQLPKDHIFKCLRFFVLLKDCSYTHHTPVLQMRTPFFIINYLVDHFFENVNVLNSKFK